MKQAFATVVGILIFTVAMGIIGVISILGMVASTDSTPKVADNSVLVLNLNGVMQERSEDDIYGFLTGGEMSSLGLDDLAEAIDKAKTDENVKQHFCTHEWRKDLGKSVLPVYVLCGIVYRICGI